jgi:hypothetical protein
LRLYDLPTAKETIDRATLRNIITPMPQLHISEPLRSRLPNARNG